MKKKPAVTDIPRKTALSILNALSQDRHLHLDQAIADSLDNGNLQLSPRDRKFINALIFGVLRWRGKIDGIIIRHSKTPIKKIHPDVLNILRLGLFQIFFLARVPNSAAVNTCVELAKAAAPPWVIKYVNAVLRNAIRAEKEETAAPPVLSAAPAAWLAETKSFPVWLIHRWSQRFGLEECLKLCDAFNTIPPISLRCNTLKLTRDQLLKQISREAETLAPTKYSPEGLIFVNPKRPIQEFDAFANGFFQVQDEAAQLITYLLFPKPNELVLDACAGRGGKTGHIAQMMKNSGEIVAADQDPEKLSQLDLAMQGLGVSNVRACVHNFELPIQNFPYHGFDRILIDAPCSGMGVIRRNPESKWRASARHLIQCGKKQGLLLNNISKLLKIGGLLSYAVCSFEPEENEAVIHAFLSNHTNFKIQKDFPQLPFDKRIFINENGFFHAFPHRHDMDGFFAVCLKKVR